VVNHPNAGLASMVHRRGLRAAREIGCHLSVQQTQRPGVEVLWEGAWCLGELRMQIQAAAGQCSSWCSTDARAG
jgi:hypothetical protein